MIARRRRVLVPAAALVTVAALTASCGSSSGPPTGGGSPTVRPSAAAQDPTNPVISTTGSSPWRLTFQDDFTGAKGGAPDPGRWSYDTGGEPNWGNNEWEYYTDRRENSALDGLGHLAITARKEQLPGMRNCRNGPCDITSARLTTRNKFVQQWGLFEARIKIPEGTGLWPSFWMVGQNQKTDGWPLCGEIDVVEVVPGKQPGTTLGTLHGPGYSGKGMGSSTTLPNGGHLSAGFHTFGVDWAPDQVSWLLDGKVWQTRKRANFAPNQQWVFDHPFFMLLNLAVGGNLPGSPDASTPFPATMLVDWVRAYKYV